MNLIFMLFLGSISGHAKNQIEVPFNKLNQSVFVTIEKSRCSAAGETAYKLETLVPNEEYNLVCKIKNAADQYESTTPVRLLENFKYPATILKDIASSSFPELKKLGKKAIRLKKHLWGSEYFWSTPTFGTEFHTYLCPKKAKHCFRIIHGGIEYLSFEIGKVQQSAAQSESKN